MCSKLAFQQMCFLGVKKSMCEKFLTKDFSLKKSINPTHVIPFERIMLDLFLYKIHICRRNSEQKRAAKKYIKSFIFKCRFIGS